MIQLLRLVIMACGKSRRMGQDKLILPWGRTTVLGQVLKEVLTAQRLLQKKTKEAGTLEIIVIAALPPDEYLTQDVIRDFQEKRNIWKVRSRGSLSETIQAGLEGLEYGTVGIGFLPGDQVGINAHQLAELMDEFWRLRPGFLVPVAGRVQGNPKFFHRRYVPELLSLQEDQGGREVVKNYPEYRVEFNVSTSFLSDVDTPEDYYRILNSDPLR